ncbi:HipA N-terminal domain-containing protein [Halosquirtibacter laminarini]|uniref:HipA N-terminal domain-containing protein n=1 Tax=Halosquirtibacter laminarini TaxID=3374600 RepID=A0AC61NE26_9BACT|nr:HipA N-terminal domain-containing protein [Prolixibacteraceae bacterium]
MRRANVLYKDEEAGVLTQFDDGSFSFHYHKTWFDNESKPAISLTFSKEQMEYHSKYLFAFFYNMLPEGANKQILCSSKKIDHKDDFGLLLASAGNDTIGAIRVIRIN